MCQDRNTSFGEVRGAMPGFVGPFFSAVNNLTGHPSSLRPMANIIGLELPIEWSEFGWPYRPKLDDITLTTGDPKWTWNPSAPAFEIHTMPPHDGEPVDGVSVDHVVLLVPELEAATNTLGRAGLVPRLKMEVGGRPAAFFRAGPVLEVIESPVRTASIYGIAVTTAEPLEVLALRWKSMGLSVGSIKSAIQPGRRIFTVHDLDAGFAVMSVDRETVPPTHNRELYAEDQLPQSDSRRRKGSEVDTN